MICDLCSWLLERSISIHYPRICRKQREASVYIQALVKLQPSFLSLLWKTCLQQNCSLGSFACIEGPTLGPEHSNDDPRIVLCPVEPAAAPNRFKPKSRVPSLVGHLPRVSYVCLVGQSLKGRWWWWWWRWWSGRNTGGSATNFVAFALQLKKTPENLS